VAELYALGTRCGEAMAIRELILNVGISVSAPILRCDSSAALGIAQRKGLAKVKHLEVHMSAVQEWLANDRVKAVKVNADVSLADLLTKTVSGEVLARLRRLFGLGAEVCAGPSLGA
jgi:hypothetical protein